jgi:dTDP-4-amino-4,6-dideoxygalactose transaminase
MKRIYGGIIGAFDRSRTPAWGGQDPYFLTGMPVFTANGRSALELIVRRIKPRKVWLPNYMCKTMLTPAITNGSWETYDINRFLHVDSRFIDHVEPNDIVVFINYFGFSYPEELGNTIQAKGAWVVEDSCMGLFTIPSPNSHFVIRSLTKNLGVADGGIATSQCFIDLSVDLPAPPKDWINLSRVARVERVNYEVGYTDSKRWLTQSVMAKKLSPTEPCSISNESRTAFFASYDYDTITERQRQNYRFLELRLREHAVLSFRGSNTSAGCPGGFFPIVVMQRDKLQKALFKDNIFPAIHWRLPWKNNSTEAEWLSSKLLSIPCDWRYTEEDMAHIASRIRFHLSKLN